MSEGGERITRFVKETSLLRKDLAGATEFGGPITLEFSGADLAALVYALALTYITEWLNHQPEREKVMLMISDASAAVLAQSSSGELDAFLKEVLDPEEEDDAA